ncbi:MAG: hypothetical protein GC160_24020 [Acidobacteria bacterium]|nr:hypothetical protein [Acidobacteriota bacterium]
MRVLFINQFFLPDGAATAQLLGDVVAAMSGEVGVVCGQVGYAGAQNGGSIASQGPSLAVWRVAVPAFGHGKGRKLWSYGGFYLKALATALARSPRGGVVVTMTTPPLLGLIGLALQRLRGAKHYIWEMDMYPDVATELGVFRRGGWTDRVVGWLADWPRRNATGVIALGPCMAERLVRRGVSLAKIHICHNWADGQALTPREFVSDGTLKVLYSGNFGLAHDFETVAGALESLGADPRFSFLFSGGGPQWAQLKALCTERGYTSCRFQEFQPREALNDLLGWCDVGLVTQKDGTQGTVVPSKTYGLMAAGRGILFVGPEDATPSKVIDEHGAGWRIRNGCADDLVAVLLQLQQDAALYTEAGRRARRSFEREYDQPVGVRRVIDVLGLPTGEAI